MFGIISLPGVKIGLGDNLILTWGRGVPDIKAAFVSVVFGKFKLSIKTLKPTVNNKTKIKKNNFLEMQNLFSI